ncbi:Trans-O-hydroxybenzylidenepyruvate hydratase-aldolase [Neomoorella glycerini]|uniref:Trans-O-hydroxybenzylidenepyruvate hydratase-aldolase n=2 Tax=Neomoorella glycerini TaxID=55779 RepID=A0A6I5ZU47_9FIRM|nr:Trans-O-hydroxybenzylidenepyruvate hydratase-aldolase [Moorella glycerini]
MGLKFSAQDVRGIYNIIPTPATPNAHHIDADDTVNYEATYKLVNMLIDEGVDAILTNGTFGEGATLTEKEHIAFVAKVIETAGGRVPVFAGATTLNTRDTIRRGKLFREMGATGLFLGRPMWCECDDNTIVGFYSDIATALPDTPLIIYDNPEAFKGKLSPRVYSRLAGIPNIIASKYIAIGPQYLDDVEACGDSIRLLPLDSDWYYARKWVGEKAPACWTGSGNCGMAVLRALKKAIESGDDAYALEITRDIRYTYKTLFPHGSFKLFSLYNIPLEKARFDAAGLVEAGPARPPYHHVPQDYLEGAREAGRRWAEINKKYSG